MRFNHLFNRCIMKNQWINRAGILLVATLMATGLNAQSPGKGHRGMAQKLSLELSQEQQSQMTELRTAHFKTMNPLQNKMAELKAKERTLLSEEHVDMKAIYTVIDEQTTLLNKIRKLQAEHRLKVRGILTDEQVMKMEQRRHPAGGQRTNGNEYSRPPFRGGPHHRNVG